MNTLYLERLKAKQLQLASKVVLKDSFNEVESVGGVDVAYSTDSAYGALAVLDYKSLEVVEVKTACMETSFPYVPTFLSFREYPVIERLYSKLEFKPTVLLIDGNGILHPYGIGLASHTGVLLDTPTVGIAKSLLCGNINRKGEVELDNKVVGYALRTSSTKPIYVSPGHKISLETSLKIAKRFCKTRIPEPIKKAHAKAAELKRNCNLV